MDLDEMIARLQELRGQYGNVKLLLVDVPEGQYTITGATHDVDLDPFIAFDVE